MFLECPDANATIYQKTLLLRVEEIAVAAATTAE